ncbi:aminoglycoside phosphotransferase [Nocardiopsis gilva YIM 90087]|uniref:Aminoglycoside phosphotransferase n=2 Tax=Nocardiopsis gilva TaxID=280236 RepID=A0A223S389_9ACTN|nr:aminoglycoside phosphotransferase [Nocardiopsis gilva YIM 90087]
MTPEQLAHRTSRAVDAAVQGGRDFGLTVTEPRVLHDLFSVVVHLAPSPVVARVLTVVPQHADLDSLAGRQRVELDMVRWLADRGTPVVPPSLLIPAEPVRVDGFSMTFWQLVEEVKDREPDYVANAGLVPGLHAAMRDYPGELGFLSAAEPRFIDDGIAMLEQRPDLIDPADLERMRREWRVLEPIVRSRTMFEWKFPGIDVQPVHGDSPVANIFHGVGGDLYADFEMVTLGPVEWDMALLGPDCEAAYNCAAQRRGMRPLNEDVLSFVNAVGMLVAFASLALTPQLPLLVDAMRQLPEQWRSMPFAGSLAA